MTNNIDKLISEFENKKEIIDIFENSRFKDRNKIDGNKLSTLAVKLASRIDTDNKNIKALCALQLICIASTVSASQGQRLLTKALGLMS